MEEYSEIRIKTEPELDIEDFPPSYLGIDDDCNDEKRILRCHYCHLKFDSVKEYCKHARETHQGRIQGRTKKESRQVFDCNFCTKEFVTVSDWRQHERVHHTHLREFICDICSKVYREKNKIEEHLNAHTGNRPFKCATCKRGFYAKGDLSKHMKIHED